MIIGIILLIVCAVLLIQAPKTLSLREEERLLKEYFRRVDRGEEP